MRPNVGIRLSSITLLLAACANPVQLGGSGFDLGSADLRPSRDLASGADLRGGSSDLSGVDAGGGGDQGLTADLSAGIDMFATGGDMSAIGSDMSAQGGDLGGGGDMAASPPDLHPPGPVAVGTYQYDLIQQYDLKDPPAVAWHPSGRYALVLNHAETVYRYDPKTLSIALAGSSATATVEWKGVVFIGTGDKAVLVGNETAAGQAGGRVYVWDDATSSLTEAQSEQYAGGTYPAVALSTDRTKAAILGVKGASSPYTLSVWDFTPVAGRTNVRSTTWNYTCTDLAFATDNFNNPAIAIACDSKLLHVNGGNQFVPDSVFNAATPHVWSRAQGDYALAIGSSRLYRFQQGTWTTAIAATPQLPFAFNGAFNTDGTRSLIVGSYAAPNNIPYGYVYEFRHDLYTKAEITDVSIPGFASPPYNAANGVQMKAVAFQPRCDGGLIVGGQYDVVRKVGLLIKFKATNGTPCE